MANTSRQNSLLKAGSMADSLTKHKAIVDVLLVRDAVLRQECMPEYFANGWEASE